jgi:hypothetical protein
MGLSHLPCNGMEFLRVPLRNSLFEPLHAHHFLPTHGLCTQDDGDLAESWDLHISSVASDGEQESNEDRRKRRPGLHALFLRLQTRKPTFC